MKKNLLLAIVILSAYNSMHGIEMQSRVASKAVDIAARSASRVLRNLTLFSAGAVGTTGYFLNNKLHEKPVVPVTPAPAVHESQNFEKQLQNALKNIKTTSNDYKGLLIVLGVTTFVLLGDKVEKYMKNKKQLPTSSNNQGAVTTTSTPDTSNDEEMARALHAQLNGTPVAQTQPVVRVTQSPTRNNVVVGPKRPTPRR